LHAGHHRSGEGVRIAIRVLTGTMVYAIIVLLAAKLPTAAGMMLTFPALNGLGFFYAPQASVKPMTRTMLWLPVVNGGLCATYILFFLWLARLSPVIVACGLGILISGMWLVLVTRQCVRRGIETGSQLPFAAGVTLAGIALVWASVRFGAGELALVSSSPLSTLEILQNNGLKMMLFAGCLCGFLAASAYLPIPDSVRGILAGLPIVPFGGLLSIAVDTAMGEDVRRQVFGTMAVTIWLAPAFAIWFIWAVSKVLSGRGGPNSRWPDKLFRAGVILCGWVLCFAAILIASHAIRRF
jgi:hypothetical protein